jgi:1-acyl-sn-glycerol-3-phosphate acyltransferase
MEERPDATRAEPEPVVGFGLFSVQRFRPFFLTQFLGAFNDNVFRFALVGVLAFQTATLGSNELEASTLVNIAAGLFILPFFIFSAFAGQLADKFDKARLIRAIKVAEIVIMLVGAFALVSRSLPLLFISIFLMGSQSAFFGPAKYGILPMHLHSDELTSGNAFVQSGTMVAILVGTIAGGLVSDIDNIGVSIIAISVVALAVLGWLSSLGIPAAPAETPELKVNLNVVSGTWRILRSVQADRPVLLSVLGIAWFWFFGSILIVQLPVYVLEVLGGGQPVATLLLATFTIGIVVGALLCDKMSGKRVEIGLVPMGALGMTIFAADFSLIPAERMAVPGEVLTAGQFLSTGVGLHVLIAVSLLAISAGLYIVPLYSMIQLRTDRGRIARVVAFNNVLDAALMVGASVIAILMLDVAGLTIPQLVLAVTMMHVAVVCFIFLEVPEFALRLVVWLITHSLYRIDARGLENIPKSGAAVLVCNHVSLADALVITAKCRRPVRFVMHYKIYEMPFMKLLFRAGKVIPIASASEDAELLDRALDAIAETLDGGGLVGIFPEGQLTRDGDIGEFRSGIERIVERTPVPIVPMATRGLWGTFFSRAGGRTMSHWPRHWLSLIVLNIGTPMPPSGVTAAGLRQRVAELQAEA